MAVQDNPYWQEQIRKREEKQREQDQHRSNEQLATIIAGWIEMTPWQRFCFYCLFVRIGFRRHPKEALNLIPYFFYSVWKTIFAD